MRIGMYHCQLPEPGRKPGGVEIFVHRLANALVAAGHEVAILTYAAAPHDAAYETVRLRPHRAGASQVLRQYVMPWRFNARSFERFDVFHCHGDDWFWFRRRLPTVRTFYGSALLEARTATSWKRRIDKSVVFALELLAGLLADARYGIGPDSQVIYQGDGLLGLGVDPPRAAAAAERRPAIVFVGTWAGRKRGELLHRVFRDHVRPRVPDAELWMVSDACEPAPGVVWHPSPSDEEISALMSRASVFCLPSTYEGFGIPYLEAMSHGLAVVATPNVGADMLLAGGAGELVEEEALGDTLVRLLSDDGSRERLADAARRRALDYSWQAVTRDYERAYALAIERWRGGQASASAPAARR
jgi:phosphatidyl-myo-inositol alpha-mannosyltransferase